MVDADHSISVFAIDPGPSTGWAHVAGYDCSVGTITEAHEDMLFSLLRYFMPRFIVIEQMPMHSPWRPEAVTIYNLCERAIRQHVGSQGTWDKVLPGVWKPMTDKEGLPFEMKTQHEKDAYRLSRFYLYQKGYLKRSAS